MANADKCYLNIPFKEYLKRLKVDADDRLDHADLDRAAAEEFENYKEIERIVNNPDCGECDCIGWKGETHLTVANTDTIALAGGTNISAEMSYWTTREDKGGITVPAAGSSGFRVSTTGWYQITAAVNLVSATGTDPAVARLTITKDPTFTGNTGWANQSYLIPSVTGATVQSSALLDIIADDGFVIILGLHAAAAATRSVTVSNVSGYSGLQLAVYKVCGC